MKRIAYYITAHGYGHGTRSCDILNALHAMAPDVETIVKTDLPESFMRSRLPRGIELRKGAFDTGLVQKDSIQVDLEASLHALEALHQRERELIEHEAAFIAAENIGVVVSDIPAIPLAAAQLAGIPNIATSNFGWNWIYGEFAEQDPRWRPHVEWIRDVYQKTELLLRQPFAEKMESFPNQIDLPLLAKPGTSQRDLVSKATGADANAKWALLSFTSLNLSSAAVDHIAANKEWTFFTVEPLAWEGSGIHCIPRSTTPFANMVASMDVVVTKPGFGIVSECIANNKPIIYSDRANFREYGILIECIGRYCRNAFISTAELYSGQLERALSTIESAPQPIEAIERGGAELAAGIILEAMAR